MRITHVSESWPDTTFEIETDRYGNYTIKAGGKVIKRVTSVTDYVGKPKWGSKKLELNAVDDAKAAIERLRDGGDKLPEHAVRPMGSERETGR